MLKGTPLSIEIVDEADGRFMICTFADGEVLRELVVPKSKLVALASPFKGLG
jgi:hypothetical protein